MFVIPGLPEIRKGHSLPKLIALAARRAKIIFEDGDVLVVAQKNNFESGGPHCPSIEGPAYRESQ